MRPDKLPLLIVAAVALAACSGAASRPAPPGGEVLVLAGATVIDGTGAAPRPGTTIVVRERRIAEIFPAGSRALPAGATVLDLRGYHVIPGLIDSHAHLASFDRGGMQRPLLRFALLGGVTTVRDMGGSTARVAGLAAEARADSAESPRIFFSAVVAGPRWFATYDSARIRYWSGGSPPGRAPGVRLLSADGEVEAIAEEARRLGATGIKVYSDVPADRLAALAAAAQRRGLRVWSHAVVPPARPGQVVAAGADVVSHADQLVWAAAAAGDSIGSRAVRGRLLREAPAGGAAVGALLADMRERGVLLEPTLLVMALGAARAEGADRARGDTLLAWAAAVTRRAHALGVPIVAGTDALGMETPNIHSEMQMLVERAGLAPLEAIRAATEAGARALGAQDSLGTVAVGKLADLVVLRADPAADVRNTQTVAYVVRGGRVHRREEPWATPQLAAPPP